ncbi:MAG: ABC transporter substrate-binding protein [Verrucomicrobiota bacterium]
MILFRTIRRKHHRLSCLLLGCLTVAACRTEQQETSRKSGFDEFIAAYNKHIRGYLEESRTTTEKEIAEVESRIASASGDEPETLKVRLASLLRDREKWNFRTDLGDYLKISDPSEIPTDLVWENGMDQPEIGDPAAKKGGAFRRYILSFPPTIRPFGENSNNSFRGELYDTIDMPLVSLHPDTMKLIPGVAREWAVSSDGRTTYFRIDPAATYSDGKPVHAKDYLMYIYVRISDHVVNPYAKQYFRENMAQFAVYDDHTLSISLPEAKVFAPAVAGAAIPSSPAFYSDYGPDFSERYQWRFAPTTGAYEVRPEDIVKGASITQTRVKNWWAKDYNYYKYRFNPDKIVHTVVRDESKAFELFRAGELDTALLTLPEYWYEKSEIEPVYKGWIERVTFYNRYPRLPRGLYLNVARPLVSDRNVRLGIQHAINWRKVIDTMFRGDFRRLNAFNEGYTLFSDPSITARPFSIDEARNAFAAAGFTKEGPDGILRRADGTRLSVAVTYPSMPQYDRMFAILREEARSCGFDLRLDGLEATVAYKKEMQKQHDIAMGAWLIDPIMPDFHQFLHSTNARDDRGNLKTQTNNLFSWGRADTDALCDIVRQGRTIEEIKDATGKLQHIIHDEAIFVPGYTVDFVRIGSWRWLRWPDSETTKFAPPLTYDPHEAFVYWIDDDLKKETQAARRSGKSFGESNRVIDEYRITPGAAPQDAPGETGTETP